MNIYTHARTNYIERVLGIDRDRVGSDIVEFANEQIEKAVREPEIIHHKEGEDSPIHIRNGVAVPVKDGNIPTAYRASNFIGKDGNRVQEVRKNRV